MRKRVKYLRRRRAAIFKKRKLSRTRAAVVIQRRFRSRKIFSLQRRSVPNAHERTRQYGYTYSTLSIQSQAGLFRDIEFPGVNPSVVNARTSNHIRTYGIKLWIEFQNMTGKNVLCNWAILQPKDPKGSGSTANQRFFRDAVSATSRWWSFTSNLLTYDPRFKYYNINPDEHTVLIHKRFILDTEEDTPTPPHTQNRSQKVLSKYLKFNKIMNFEGQTDTYPENRPIFVFWWSVLNPNDYSTNLGAVDISMNSVVFFSDK